ncbi:MoaD family protein [Natronococcus sp. A-GB1]|uniref:ubiquitin-like small modifier protein 1 n=1 Tax=Natronococcus sp. A-GB1 TaxID=3037648 RepID=UPI00241D9473|nr:ubiquitin-like small modifier protein 1 [Natronococcus sp. A-GB1]MDG5761669.1 MoaD family protein [Natronococcus sp. A-GB1]
MNIELRFFATVREAVGERAITRKFEADTTVRDVLSVLEGEYSALDGMLLDDGEVASSITVLHNGVHVTHLDGSGTELVDGDRLAITPPVTGG